MVVESQPLLHEAEPPPGLPILRPGQETGQLVLFHGGLQVARSLEEEAPDRPQRPGPRELVDLVVHRAEYLDGNFRPDLLGAGRPDFRVDAEELVVCGDNELRWEQVRVEHP